MINMERVRRNIARMLRKFPVRHAEIYRLQRDAYGQMLPERTLIGTAECWIGAMSRPGKWAVSNAGTAYDDGGAVWATLVWSDDLPAVRHEDICVLDDGSEYTVRNIHNAGDLRVYWQLTDRRDAV